MSHESTKRAKAKERTTTGIPRWSPARVLVGRSLGYLGESGRDPEFSSTYGRTWWKGMLGWYMSMLLCVQGSCVNEECRERHEAEEHMWLGEICAQVLSLGCYSDYEIHGNWES
jgi:hypothetical protein